MNNKIAIVSNTSWSIYNFRLGLLRRLKADGYNVVVIAPKDNFSAKIIAEGIAYEEIFLKNHGTNPFSELLVYRQLSKIYKKLNPDLIFHYTIKPNIYGSLAAANNNIPSIAITTGLGHLFDFKNGLVRWLTFRLYKIAARLSKEIWFLNENDKDVFVYKGITTHDKAKVLKSEGINTKWFKPNNEKKFLTPYNFIFAGRLLLDKGIREFVEAAKIINKTYPQTFFKIIGFINQTNPNSVPYEQLHEWQKEKFISYEGETTDIRPYLEQADCLIFPSYYREGISRILMEAAAMETPIITTDNVGCRDVVDHEKNGYLVKPRDVDDLVKSIERFIELHEEDKLLMGKLGREKMIDEFEESKIIKHYLTIINRYLPESNHIQRKEIELNAD